MSRILTAILLALGLGACAAVSSDRPLFTAIDARDAPVARPGLWVMPSAGCRFSPRASAASWPDCANGALVTAASLIGGKRDATGAFTEALNYQLASGDPAVMQILTPASRDAGDPGIIYVGIRPLAADAEGQITQARVWMALCGPPAIVAGPPAAKPAKLSPGLTPVKGKTYCVAKTQTALRAAIARSEAWAFQGKPDDFGLIARWVRDGEK
ncbi:hypothetical protein [Phenylobacterium aquaticum]|uniref:hypothetical protein n=1 Tax=Phenylobacterium aquaticum TaxID=1763816 RepID=UPI0026EB99C6|nr:hypothetical protein [Phenylobacterium aquaticum]